MTQTKRARQTKPKCTKGTACGFTCISGKLTCSSRILGRDAAALVKAATETKAGPPQIELYTEVRTLGQGAFGVTHLTDRGTVVKTLLLSAGSDYVGVEKEYKALQVMSELGVGPKPLGLSKDQIEMEFVDGVTVKDKLSRANTADSEETKTAILDKAVAAAIKLHRAGYAHNDLHTENAMIDSSGNAKIIDGGMLDKVGDEVADGFGWKDVSSNGFKDLSKLLKPLSLPKAEKLYNTILDKLDSNGSLDEYRSIRSSGKRSEAEIYLHQKYLTVLDELGL